MTQAQKPEGKTIYHLWMTPADDDEPLTLSISPDGVTDDSERYFVRDPLITGSKWTAHLNRAKETVENDSFQITSIGDSCTVGAHEFKQCITIRQTDDMDHLITDTTYARNVGPIKFVFFDTKHPQHPTITMTILSWKVAR